MYKLILFFFLFLSFNAVHSQTDLSDLFAPPTAAEITAVKTEWATRDHTPYNWTVLGTGTQGQYTISVVSHTVGSLTGDVHYGVVRYPKNYDPTMSYPVLMINHGGASGTTTNVVSTANAACYDNFFVGGASFRSEPLDASGLGLGILTSGGDASEMDGDTDDALALLNGILTIAGADPLRIAVTGGSRGGGVSHLMSAKDDRIKRAFILYGATNHMDLPGQQVIMQNYVDNGGGLNPPQRATYDYGVAPYLAGDLTLAEARLALLRRSVLYFIDELPAPYSVHHGGNDGVVYPLHSQELEDAFTAAGVTTPDFEYIEYPGYGHSLPQETGVPTLRQTFLCALEDIPLAVELLDFNGTCQEKLEQISIQWTAIIDQSSNAFELQWSGDSKDWETIKTIEVNNSGALSSYIYNDYNYSKGQNYYRLKEIEYSGKVEYHKTIAVDCGQHEITLFPNPSNGIVYIQYDQKLNKHPEQLLVFDINGQQVFEQQLTGSNDEEMNLGHLPKGVYLCHFITNGQRLIERVILM